MVTPKPKEIDLSRGARTALAALALRRGTTLAEIAEELVWAEIGRLGLKVGAGEAPGNDAPDADKAETQAKIHARKIVGWTKAASDAEPILNYIKAGERVITAADIGKTAWNILTELFEAKHEEIETSFAPGTED